MSSPPDILIGWGLLSKSQQTDIKQILLPKFTSYLSKNDVAKLVSKRCGKKNRNTATTVIVKGKGVAPPQLITKLLAEAKFHPFIKQDKDGLPNLDLVKIDSFVKCVEKNRFNGKDASEAWQTAIMMFIVCNIKKGLPIQLSKKEFDCDRLNARYHTAVPTAIEKWWQLYCFWKKKGNVERAQLKQYIEFVKRMREQKRSEGHESEFINVILTRLDLIQHSQTMHAKYEKKLNRMIMHLSKRN